MSSALLNGRDSQRAAEAPADGYRRSDPWVTSQAHQRQLSMQPRSELVYATDSKLQDLPSQHCYSFINGSDVPDKGQVFPEFASPSTYFMLESLDPPPPPTVAVTIEKKPSIRYIAKRTANGQSAPIAPGPPASAPQQQHQRPQQPLAPLHPQTQPLNLPPLQIFNQKARPEQMAICTVPNVTTTGAGAGPGPGPGPGPGAVNGSGGDIVLTSGPANGLRHDHILEAQPLMPPMHLLDAAPISVWTPSPSLFSPSGAIAHLEALPSLKSLPLPLLSPPGPFLDLNLIRRMYGFLPGSPPPGLTSPPPPPPMPMPVAAPLHTAGHGRHRHIAAAPAADSGDTRGELHLLHGQGRVHPRRGDAVTGCTEILAGEASGAGAAKPEECGAPTRRAQQPPTDGNPLGVEEAAARGGGGGQARGDDDGGSGGGGVTSDMFALLGSAGWPEIFKTADLADADADALPRDGLPPASSPERALRKLPSHRTLSLPTAFSLTRLPSDWLLSPSRVAAPAPPSGSGDDGGGDGGNRRPGGGSLSGPLRSLLDFSSIGLSTLIKEPSGTVLTHGTDATPPSCAAQEGLGNGSGGGGGIDRDAATPTEGAGVNTAEPQMAIREGFRAPTSAGANLHGGLVDAGLTSPFCVPSAGEGLPPHVHRNTGLASGPSDVSSEPLPDVQPGEQHTRLLPSRPPPLAPQSGATATASQGVAVPGPVPPPPSIAAAAAILPCALRAPNRSCWTGNDLGGPTAAAALACPAAVCPAGGTGTSAISGRTLEDGSASGLLASGEDARSRSFSAALQRGPCDSIQGPPWKRQRERDLDEETQAPSVLLPLPVVAARPAARVPPKAATTLPMRVTTRRAAAREAAAVTAAAAAAAATTTAVSGAAGVDADVAGLDGRTNVPVEMRDVPLRGSSRMRTMEPAAMAAVASASAGRVAEDLSEDAIAMLAVPNLGSPQPGFMRLHSLLMSPSLPSILKSPLPPPVLISPQHGCGVDGGVENGVDGTGSGSTAAAAPLPQPTARVIDPQFNTRGGLVECTPHANHTLREGVVMEGNGRGRQLAEAILPPSDPAAATASGVAAFPGALRPACAPPKRCHRYPNGLLGPGTLRLLPRQLPVTASFGSLRPQPLPLPPQSPSIRQPQLSLPTPAPGASILPPPRSYVACLPDRTAFDESDRNDRNRNGGGGFAAVTAHGAARLAVSNLSEGLSARRDEHSRGGNNLGNPIPNPSPDLNLYHDLDAGLIHDHGGDVKAANGPPAALLAGAVPLRIEDAVEPSAPGSLLAIVTDPLFSECRQPAISGWPAVKGSSTAANVSADDNPVGGGPWGGAHLETRASAATPVSLPLPPPQLPLEMRSKPLAPRINRLLDKDKTARRMPAGAQAGTRTMACQDRAGAGGTVAATNSRVRKDVKINQNESDDLDYDEEEEEEEKYDDVSTVTMESPGEGVAATAPRAAAAAAAAAEGALESESKITMSLERKTPDLQPPHSPLQPTSLPQPSLLLRAPPNAGTVAAADNVAAEVAGPPGQDAVAAALPAEGGRWEPEPVVLPMHSAESEAAAPPQLARWSGSAGGGGGGGTALMPPTMMFSPEGAGSGAGGPGRPSRGRDSSDWRQRARDLGQYGNCPASKVLLHNNGGALMVACAAEPDARVRESNLTSTETLVDTSSNEDGGSGSGNGGVGIGVCAHRTSGCQVSGGPVRRLFSSPLQPHPPALSSLPLHAAKQRQLPHDTERWMHGVEMPVRTPISLPPGLSLPSAEVAAVKPPQLPQVASYGTRLATAPVAACPQAPFFSRKRAAPQQAAGCAGQFCTEAVWKASLPPPLDLRAGGGDSGSAALDANGIATDPRNPVSPYISNTDWSAAHRITQDSAVQPQPPPQDNVNHVNGTGIVGRPECEIPTITPVVTAQQLQRLQLLQQLQQLQLLHHQYLQRLQPRQGQQQGLPQQQQAMSVPQRPDGPISQPLHSGGPPSGMLPPAVWPEAQLPHQQQQQLVSCLPPLQYTGSSLDPMRPGPDLTARPLGHTRETPSGAQTTAAEAILPAGAVGHMYGSDDGGGNGGGDVIFPGDKSINNDIKAFLHLDKWRNRDPEHQALRPNRLTSAREDPDQEAANGREPDPSGEVPSPGSRHRLHYQRKMHGRLQQQQQQQQQDQDQDQDQKKLQLQLQLQLAAGMGAAAMPPPPGLVSMEDFVRGGNEMMSPVQTQSAGLTGECGATEEGFGAGSAAAQRRRRRTDALGVIRDQEQLQQVKMEPQQQPPIKPPLPPLATPTPLPKASDGGVRQRPGPASSSKRAASRACQTDSDSDYESDDGATTCLRSAKRRSVPPVAPTRRIPAIAVCPPAQTGGVRGAAAASVANRQRAKPYEGLPLVPPVSAPHPPIRRPPFTLTRPGQWYPWLRLRLYAPFFEQPAAPARPPPRAVVNHAAFLAKQGCMRPGIAAGSNVGVIGGGGGGGGGVDGSRTDSTGSGQRRARSIDVPKPPRALLPSAGAAAGRPHGWQGPVGLAAAPKPVQLLQPALQPLQAPSMGQVYPMIWPPQMDPQMLQALLLAAAVAAPAQLGDGSGKAGAG